MESGCSEVFQGYGAVVNFERDGFTFLVVSGGSEFEIVEAQRVVIVEAVDNIFAVAFSINKIVGSSIAPQAVVAFAAGYYIVTRAA